MDALGDEDVRGVFEMDRQVSREAHSYLEFLRFEELDTGILAAKINPKCHILPLIVEHFADRLWLEHWIILDTGRGMSCVHMAKKGYFFTNDLKENSLKDLPKSKNEQEMDKLWKCFVHSIAIGERRNIVLQRQNLPLRYRTYMNEMQEADRSAKQVNKYVIKK